MWGGDEDCRRVSTLSSSLQHGDVSCGSRKSSSMTLSLCNKHHAKKLTLHRTWFTSHVITITSMHWYSLKYITTSLEANKTCQRIKQFINQGMWWETVGGSGLSWAICKFAPRSRQITTSAPHHSVFTDRVPFLLPNQQCQSTEGKAASPLSYVNMKQKLIL